MAKHPRLFDESEVESSLGTSLELVQIPVDDALAAAVGEAGVITLMTMLCFVAVGGGCPQLLLVQRRHRRR